MVLDARALFKQWLDPDAHLIGCLFLKLAGKSSPVTATCPATGRLVRLTVTEETMNDLNPPGAVLSLCLPGETISAEYVQATTCTYGQFFVDCKPVSAWATS